MESTLTLTRERQVSVHTLTAPESGWRTSAHLVELPTQLILVDTLLLPMHTAELVTYASSLDKAITRVYITHGHPDHFAGASLIDAPKYALPSVRQSINQRGDAVVRGAYALTGLEDVVLANTASIDSIVEAGEEIIDGVRFSFETVLDAETADQLTIALPDEDLILAGDVIYNRVHAFIAEQHFDTWIEAINQLQEWPYATVLPGHGLPGARDVYVAMRDYLAAARNALAAASDAQDLNRRLVAAYPGYGGLAMQPLQNYFLFPPTI